MNKKKMTNRILKDEISEFDFYKTDIAGKGLFNPNFKPSKELDDLYKEHEGRTWKESKLEEIKTIKEELINRLTNCDDFKFEVDMDGDITLVTYNFEK